MDSRREYSSVEGISLACAAVVLGSMARIATDWRWCSLTLIESEIAKRNRVQIGPF